MMFCKKCGSELEDGTEVCNVCGESQTTDDVQEKPASSEMEAQEQLYTQADSITQPKKSNKSLKIGLAVGAAVLLVGAVVAIILFIGIGGGKGSAEEMTEKFLNSYKEFDGKTMTSCFAYSDEHKEEMEEMEEELIDMFDALKENSKELDMKLSYKMGDIKKVTKDDLEEFWENAEENDVLVSEKDVKELSKCDAKIIAVVSGMENEQEMDIYVGKYKGDWKVIYME